LADRRRGRFRLWGAAFRSHKPGGQRSSGGPASIKFWEKHAPRFPFGHGKIAASKCNNAGPASDGSGTTVEKLYLPFNGQRRLRFAGIWYTTAIGPQGNRIEDSNIDHVALLFALFALAGYQA